MYGRCSLTSVLCNFAVLLVPEGRDARASRSNLWRPCICWTAQGGGNRCDAVGASVRRLPNMRASWKYKRGAEPGRLIFGAPRVLPSGTPRGYLPTTITECLPVLNQRAACPPNGPLGFVEQGTVFSALLCLEKKGATGSGSSVLLTYFRSLSY